MFFEVKIFNADGELKRVVSPKKLSNKFWKESQNALPDFTDPDAPSEDWGSKAVWEKVRLEMDDSCT